MRLVVMSDTHGYHKRLTVPDGDVLIHAGDFSMRAKAYDIMEFAGWFKSLPHKHKIMTPGNHDMACEGNRSRTDEEFGRKVHYLVHQTAIIEGVKFFVSPYSIAIYDPSPWAFDYQKTSARSKDLWEQIPMDTDVLVTHGPPKGILDKVLHPFPGEDANVGDLNLLSRVMDVKPKVHLFGHIHEGYGSYIRELWETKFYNVSVCDADYKPVNPITVIDL